MTELSLENPMYETLSTDYDRFVDWPSRLTLELPFITGILQERGARTILDAAAGTGMHAIALMQRGYQASGADISHGMVEQARLNAKSAGVEVHIEIGALGAGTHVWLVHPSMRCCAWAIHYLTCYRGALDKTLLISLPKAIRHITNPEPQFRFSSCNQARWMEPQSHSENGAEWIFRRFYDFEIDGL
jgi:SAM-dependent methyltransferase